MEVGNIALTKRWSDNLDCDDMWIRLDIDIWAKDIYVHQVFDSMISSLNEFGDAVIQKTRNPYEMLTYVFEPIGYGASRVEFCFHPSSSSVKIVVIIDFLDSFDHQSKHQISLLAELQMLEDFGHGIKRLASGNVGDSRRLNPNLPARCIPVEEIDFPYNRLYGE